LVILGTVTALKELGGQDFPILPPADRRGLFPVSNRDPKPRSPASGKPFKPWQAYKEASSELIHHPELHRRCHEAAESCFISLYPAAWPTHHFRNNYPLFQTIFPWFQRNSSGGYVNQEACRERVPDQSALADPPSPSSGPLELGNPQNRGPPKTLFRQPFPKRPADPPHRKLDSLGYIDEIGPRAG